MRIRWAVAAMSALALALLTMNVPLPWFDDDAQAAPGAGVCPANAKPANLSFTLKDMNGKDVRLADYKGKVILLDFWATWCGPCKIEIPWFVEFQNKYGKSGLQVIGVSVDDTVDKLKPFVSDMKMNYPILQGLGHDEVQDAYGPIWGIPVTAVISRDGRVCTKHTGISSKQSFENEIKSLLGGEPQPERRSVAERIVGAPRQVALENALTDARLSNAGLMACRGMIDSAC